MKTDITTATETRMAVTPADLLLKAVESGADLDRMEQLMALQERWEANQAKKAFVEAMVEFKSKPIIIGKNKHVSFTTSKGRTEYDHAELVDVTEAIVPRLAEHGLSHDWSVSQEGTKITVTCTITHRLGHSKSVSMTAPADDSGGKNSIQAIASAKTYLERYTLLAVTGTATGGEDDDGRGYEDPPQDPAPTQGADADRRFHSREAKDERAQQKIERHLKAAAKNAESITYIKERLAAGDGIAAAKEWQALDEWDRVALSLTAEKGGTAFTDEQGRQISAAKAQLAEQIKAEADREAERVAKENLS